MSEPFEKESYIAVTLDPVHIGTGGYRLGRVDNTIIREPGTNIPKIPGSSISGAARAYTAMAVQSDNFVEVGPDFIIDDAKYKKCKYLRPAYQFDTDSCKRIIVKCDSEKNHLYEGDDPSKAKYYSCAGKGADSGKGHCGKPDCLVCVPFGFSKKESSFQGLAQFYDIRILFFPVHSMQGPVWVTSHRALSDHVKNHNFLTANGEKFVSLGPDNHADPMNFGWLLLESEGHKPLADKLSEEFSFLKEIDCLKEIMNRLYLVSDKIFSQIVNDNLEVRTSVAIDPLTGAAEEGALYTYEAIPRATVMGFDIVYNNPQFFRIDNSKIVDDAGEPADVSWVKNSVEKGLAYFKMLGVGGMNTRGFGRLKIYGKGGMI